MKKQQLLQESEIRKMMKFANIGALSDGFVGRLNEQDEMEPEEEAPMDAAGELGGDLEAEPDEGEDMGMELEPEEGEEGGDEILQKVEDAMEAFKDALELAGPEGQRAAEMLTIEKEGEPGEEEGGEELAAMGGEEEGGMDMDMADMDMGGEEEALAEMVDEEVQEEEMINEVARRVARRLRRG